VHNTGWLEFTRQRSLADFSAPGGERQKHICAFNGALASSTRFEWQEIKRPRVIPGILIAAELFFTLLCLPLINAYSGHVY
jgi:hypothetical protein